jgi:hypothetical protein
VAVYPFLSFCKNFKLFLAARQDCLCTKIINIVSIRNRPEISFEFSHNCLLSFFLQYLFSIPFTCAFYRYCSGLLFSLFFTRLKHLPHPIFSFNMFFSVYISHLYPIFRIPMFLLPSLIPFSFPFFILHVKAVSPPLSSFLFSLSYLGLLPCIFTFLTFHLIVLSTFFCPFYPPYLRQNSWCQSNVAGCFTMNTICCNTEIAVYI